MNTNALAQARLVTDERRGYWVDYSINQEALEESRWRLNGIGCCGCHGEGQWCIFLARIYETA